MNSVFLVGRLGADPEVRRTSSGKVVCNLRVATERKGKADELRLTDWHRVVVWDRQAELCERYLNKGRMVAVSGRLQHRSWEAEGGERRSRSEVVAYRVQFFSAANVTQGPVHMSPAPTQRLPF